MTITVADLKTHLNITGADDDALLADKIAAATAWVEKYADALSTVPDICDEAVRRVAAHFYEDREGTSRVPDGVWDLIAPYRKYDF